MIFSSPYPEGGRGHVKMPPSTPVAGCGAVMLLTSYCKVLAALEANAPVAMAYDSGAICANVSAGKQPARTFPTCGMHHWQGRPVGITILESLRCFGVAVEFEGRTMSVLPNLTVAALYQDLLYRTLVLSIIVTPRGPRIHPNPNPQTLKPSNLNHKPLNSKPYKPSP